MTPQGKYVIFDITEFLPGRLIPEQFCEEANKNGPFFFHPAGWTAENCWGGEAVGFPTAEAALEAATEWEAKQPEREQHWAAITEHMEAL